MSQNANSVAIRHYSINEILNKEQFKIKLNVRYYFLSGANLLLLVGTYFVFEGFLNFAAVYSVSNMFIYRFAFNYTKNGQQFKPFIYDKLSKLITKTRQLAKRQKGGGCA